MAIRLGYVACATIKKRAKGRSKLFANLCLRFSQDVVGKVVGPVPACDLIYKELVNSVDVLCKADVEPNADLERLEDEHAIGPRA
ncbi:hypothetical protein BM1_10928 [Bipolaris maydis]|nr:hypothetical protein BM1_10928 [Bipolaris maydis]